MRPPRLSVSDDPHVLVSLEVRIKMFGQALVVATRPILEMNGDRPVEFIAKSDKSFDPRIVQRKMLLLLADTTAPQQVICANAVECVRLPHIRLAERDDPVLVLVPSM